MHPGRARARPHELAEMVDKELAHCYRLSPKELACHEAFPGEAEAFLTQELQRSLGETLGGPQECPTKQVGLLNASCILAGSSSSEKSGPSRSVTRLLLQMPGWALQASCVTAANPVCVWV